MRCASSFSLTDQSVYLYEVKARVESILGAMMEIRTNVAEEKGDNYETNFDTDSVCVSGGRAAADFPW